MSDRELQDIEGAIVSAIYVMRAAQKVLGANIARDRKRGRAGPSTGMCEQLERAAAQMYQALDRAKGKPPWVTCPDCGETVRTLSAHWSGCAKNRKAAEWE